MYAWKNIYSNYFLSDDKAQNIAKLDRLYQAPLESGPEWAFGCVNPASWLDLATWGRHVNATYGPL